MLRHSAAACSAACPHCRPPPRASAPLLRAAGSARGAVGGKRDHGPRDRRLGSIVPCSRPGTRPAARSAGLPALRGRTGSRRHRGPGALDGCGAEPAGACPPIRSRRASSPAPRLRRMAAGARGRVPIPRPPLRGRRRRAAAVAGRRHRVRRSCACPRRPGSGGARRRLRRDRRVRSGGAGRAAGICGARCHRSCERTAPGDGSGVTRGAGLRHSEPTSLPPARRCKRGGPAVPSPTRTRPPNAACAVAVCQRCAARVETRVGVDCHDHACRNGTPRNRAHAGHR